jgi:WD40 repeat protein
VSLLEDRAWLARVLGPGGMVVGAAFAVDHDLLLTCAHVVADAGANGPGDLVSIDFPLLRVGCEAEVLAEGWRPARGTAGDVALLRMKDAVGGVRPAPLRLLGSLAGASFVAYGFPEGYDDGLWTKGRLGMNVGLEWVQLEVDSPVAVAPGFSGSAVWDAGRNAVTALIVTRDRATIGRVAFAVPVRVLARESAVVRGVLATSLSIDPAAEAHWEASARGVKAGEVGWFFTGRRRALSELVAWLVGDGRPAMRVVTGSPGCGKSAVLARLVTTSDRGHRERIPDLLAGDPTVPPVGAVDVPFYARSRTVQDFIGLVADVYGLDPDDSASLVAVASDQHRRPVIVVDALDEATEPDELVALLNDLSDRVFRVLVGCRPHVAGALRDPEPLDLDQPPYLEPEDISAYVHRRLSVSTSLAGQAAVVGAEVADAAAGNFLVAQLVADRIAHGSAFTPPFPRDVPQALRQRLDALPRSERELARELLLPLAYALGDGLPDDLWLSGARALSRPYEPGDLRRLLNGPVGSFVLTHHRLDGRRCHRLFHEALAEALAAESDPTSDERTLWQTWTERLPKRPDGSTGWSDAPEYLLEHGAQHAAMAGRLDDLITDIGYLLVGDLHRTLSELNRAESTAGGHVAVLRLTAGQAQPLEPSRRAGLLALAARHLGLPSLAAQFAAVSNLFFQPRWAHGLGSQHQLLAGHVNHVWDVVIGRVGERDLVASAGADGTVRLWDAIGSQQLLMPLLGHSGGVRAVALGRVATCDVVVSGGEDGTVRLWNAADGQPIGEPLRGNHGQVVAVALGRAGDRDVIATGAEDGTVQLWDAALGQPLESPLPVHSGAVLGVALCRAGDRDMLASASTDETASLWDLTGEHKLVATLRGHEGRVRTVAFGHVVGREVLASAGDDGTIRLWNAANGEQLGEPRRAHFGWVTGVALARVGDRDVLASCGVDGNVRVWDAANGEQLDEPLRGHESAVLAVAVGKVGGRDVIASAGDDGTVRLWDTAPGQPGEPLRGHPGGADAIALGRVHDRDVVASAGSDGTVRLWDAADGQPLGEPLQGHEDWFLSAVALGRVGDCDVVASAGSDGTVRLWNAVDGQPFGEPIRAEGWPQAVALGRVRERDVVAFADEDGTIRLWDATDGIEFGTPLRGHVGWVRALALGKVDDRELVLSGGDDGTARLWDATDSSQVGDPLLTDGGTVFGVSFGSVGQRPVLVVADGAAVRLWDAADRQPLGEPFRGRDASTYEVALGQFGGRDLVASAGYDGPARVWDARTRAEVQVIDVVGHCSALALAAPCSLSIVSGGAICYFVAAARLDSVQE